jgi:YesN/AraC family two-component response regulator
MKNTTLLIGFSILILGILISLLLSKRIYLPIHTIESKLNSLERERQSNLSPLKQDFMRGILQGEIEYTKELLHKKLNEFKINVDENAPIQLLLLKIDRYGDFCNTHDANDRNLLKFAVMNVAAEIFSEKRACEAVDMGEDHIIVLYNSTLKTTPELLNETDNLIRNIQFSINHHLSLSLSAAVSIAAESIEYAGELYHIVLETSRYFLFHGYQAVVYADSVLNKNHQEYTYPQKSEKLLINALVASRDEEAKRIFNDIINGAKDCSYSTFNMVMIRLATAVNMSFDSIESNSGFSISYDFASFISKLQVVETMQDINNHFYSMFDHILQKLEEKKNPKYDELVGRIHDIIEKNYFNINLSRETIAEEVGLSSVYLGRLFLKLTSHAISDYICDFRLQKAKELLMSTGSSVSDISNQVGFTSPNYFHAIFKKAFGVTPSEFRQNTARKK